MSFKPDFLWGSATASYQIEGAARAHGRGPSVWDDCARQPGFVKLGATGDTACDHYNRWREDIGHMAYLGLKAYRFSVSWSRVLPDGVGAVNQAGLDFYDRLVDGLLEAGIQPWLTLFHWDYPTALYDKGGWLNPDSPHWFAEYTQILADRLSDRVGHWMTFNEPQCFIDIGHKSGRHAPGLKLPHDQVLRCAHNVLLSHGLSVQTLRTRAKKEIQIGYAPVGRVCLPHTDADHALAERKSMEGTTLFGNTWWSDPMFFGKYPDDGVKAFERDMPPIKTGDMATIQQPLDFYGTNIYHGHYVTTENGVEKTVPHDPYGMVNAFDWPITPDALYWGAKFLYNRYKLPIYITENGMCGTDYVNDGGEVLDDHRIVYTSRYLKGLKRAAEEGVDIRGYMHWSFLDNFEWADGYTKRFGLIHVDFATGKRTLKKSAHWYKTVIESNGENL
jgi:beta-glucosidase